MKTEEQIRRALINGDHVFCLRNSYTKIGYICFDGCCYDFDMTIDDVIEFIVEAGYLDDIQIEYAQ